MKLCSCLTKNPELKYHKRDCEYRVEQTNMIEVKMVQVVNEMYEELMRDEITEENLDYLEERVNKVNDFIDIMRELI